MDWLVYLSHTQRAYRKEGERFLLWAVVERRKPLSSMTTEDCAAYRAFSDVAPALHPVAALSVESHLKKLAREGRAREDKRPDHPSRWSLTRA